MTQEERIAALEVELAKHKSKLTPYEEYQAKWRAENPEAAAKYADYEPPPYNPFAFQDRMVNHFNPGRMMVTNQMKGQDKSVTKDGKTMWTATTNDQGRPYLGGVDPRDRPAELNGPAGQEAKKITKRY